MKKIILKRILYLIIFNVIFLFDFYPATYDVINHIIHVFAFLPKYFYNYSGLYIICEVSLYISLYIFPRN